MGRGVSNLIGSLSMLRGVPVVMEPGICHIVYGQPMPAEEQPYIQPGTLKASHEHRRVLTSIGYTPQGCTGCQVDAGNWVRVHLRVLSRVYCIVTRASWHLEWASGDEKLHTVSQGLVQHMH